MADATEPVEAVVAWVEGRLDGRHEGWESPEVAAARFHDGVLAHATGGPLVIGTHGMVLTAWLVSIGRLAPGPAAGEFWSGLRFPDVVAASVRLPDAPRTSPAGGEAE